MNLLLGGGGALLVVLVVTSVLRLRSRRKSETRERWTRADRLTAVGILVSLGGIVGGFIDTGSDQSGPAPRVPRLVQVDKSETHVRPNVRSLARQDDPRGANAYGPDNILDGNVRTAWVEGVSGLGIGARLTFTLPERVRLTGVRIVNGYAKDAAHLLDNAAPRSVLIRSDGRPRPLRVTLSRNSRPQSIRAEFGVTRRVSIQILSAYRGDRFQDLALSEIWFFAKAS